jgi:hypothetical protein
MSGEALKKSFRSIPLGLKLLSSPLHSTNRSIFQMDIQPSPRFGEYFRIWPGAADNEVEVLSSDRALKQLVLRVKEPRRRFVEVVRKSRWNNQEQAEARALSMGGRILAETRYDWRLELWTPEEDRRYLCGMDDLHLFLAQVEDGATVAEAHAALKPREVREAEALWPGSILRQGEWFFLPLSAEETERLRARLADWPRAVKRLEPVGPGGRNLHVADQVVRIDRRVRSRHREWRRPEVYARGRVVHADHRDLHLEGWRKVVRNREVSVPVPWEDRRVFWID